MPAMFDISAIGDKQIERAFGQLPERAQSRVIRKVNKQSVERLKNEMLINYSGRVVKEVTGETISAIESQRPTTRSRGDVVVALLPYPQDAEAAITVNALEYGTPTFAAKAPIRKAVNDNQERELGIIAKEIGKGVEREFKKLLR